MNIFKDPTLIFRLSIYGITTIQTFLYYQNSADDRPTLKVEQIFGADALKESIAKVEERLSKR